MYKGTGTAGFICATGYDGNEQPLDPLSKLGDTSILRRQVVTMQLAGVYPIVVLSGLDGLRIEHHLDYYRVIFFQMEDFSQINLERDIIPILNYLKDKCEQIVYLPAEYPLPRTETLKKLIMAEGDMRCPVYRGSKGYPMVMNMDTLLKMDLDGLEDYDHFETFLDSRRLSWTKVAVNDEGVVCSAADKDCCCRLIQAHSRQMQHPYVRIDIDFDTKVFDIRLWLLLTMVRETKSVKKACTRASISFGKAWEYINLLEEKLQYPVVERRRGGKKGGRTELTKEGIEFLEKYTELLNRVQEYTKNEFERLFDPGTDGKYL